MDIIEDITRVAHEATHKWADEGMPACWQRPWEELSEEEKNFLLVLAKDIISQPDLTPINDDSKSARQIFIEGIFWGTVRIQYAIKSGESK
jgi:hypothetical protein